MIELRHVYKTYTAGQHVLRDISFTARKGELIFITGSSGAGKTTLFNIILGLTQATSGSVLFENQSLELSNTDQIIRFRKKIGVVFQNSKLIEDMSIIDNIGLPLNIKGISKKMILQLTTEALNRFNLGHVSLSRPHELSGGEQQRIALLRATIHNPTLIIADEPTGNLDSQNERLVMDFLSEKAKSGSCVIVATHNHELIRQYSGLHFQLENGEIRTMK